MTTDKTSLAQQALALIAQRKLKPTPENYSIFYHVAQGQNNELIREIEDIDRNQAPFSAKTSAYLFKKYVVADRNDSIINDAAENANELLGEVLRSVTSFTTDTSGYNDEIGNYMERISVEVPDDNLQALLKDVLQASADMRSKGESLSQNLQKSKNEIALLKADLEHITNESQKDFLTNLFNRKAYDRMLDESVTAAKEEKTDLCLLMVDIDHFKQFNDNYGHLLGDEVIKLVAKALTHCVKGADIVARYGGEEFSVVLPNTPVAGAHKVAETIRETISKREMKRKDSGENYGRITVSIGLSKLRGEDTPLTLIKRADDALYKSKNDGRNRVTVDAS